MVWGLNVTWIVLCLGGFMLTQIVYNGMGMTDALQCKGGFMETPPMSPRNSKDFT